jgi:hypothetical protein
MDGLSLSREALSICAATALLAGCATAQGLIGRPSAAPASVAVPAVAQQETLNSPHPHAGPCVRDGSITKTTFRASGRASGWYAGSFTSHGTITASGNFTQGGTWSFTAKFKITSGGQTIPGEIHQSRTWYSDPCGNFGSDNMAFRMGSRSGRASAHVVYGSKEHFRAMLF